MDDARVADVRAEVLLDDVDDGLGVANVHGEVELDGFLEDQLEDVLVEGTVDVRLVVRVQEHPPTAVRATARDDCVEPVHVLGSHQVLCLVDEDGVVGPIRRRSPNGMTSMSLSPTEVLKKLVRPGDLKVIEHRPTLVRLLFRALRQDQRLARAGPAEDQHARVACQRPEEPRLPRGRAILLLEHGAALRVDDRQAGELAEQPLANVRDPRQLGAVAWLTALC